MAEDNRCTLPFDGRIRILLHKNIASACCKTPPYKIDPINGLYTDQLIQLRKDIINNVKNSQCSECWEIEKLGGQSYRLGHSTHFNKKIEWNSLDPYVPIQDIEVVFSNKCQMQCVYCSSDISSMWEDYEYKNTGKRIEILENSIKLEDIIDITKLRNISVTGGEPMLDEKCISFIQALPFDPNRKISIVTNLSYGDAVFNTLQNIIEKHKNFFVVCSLDSVGENINRKYLNWDRWHSNFEKLVINLQDRLQYKYSGLMINITVTALSYKDVQGVIEYIIGFRKKNYKGIMFDINPINMNTPTSLASDNIDKNYNICIDKEDEKYLSFNEKRKISAFNRLINNVEYDDIVAEKTRQHLTEYYKI